MLRYPLAMIMLCTCLVFAACSRKTAPPPKPNVAVAAAPSKTTDSIAIVEMKEKMGYSAPVKTAVPKSIVVSDAAAKKAVDGRYYYDLEGKRYWRNKKDGKYYLYYKGMFEDKNFQ